MEKNITLSNILDYVIQEKRNGKKRIFFNKYYWKMCKIAMMWNGYNIYQDNSWAGVKIFKQK